MWITTACGFRRKSVMKFDAFVWLSSFCKNMTYPHNSMETNEECLVEISIKLFTKKGVISHKNMTQEERKKRKICNRMLPRPSSQIYTENDDNPSYVRFCRIKIGPNIHKFTKNISKVDSSGVAWASSRQQHIIDSSSSRTLKESKTEKIKNLTLNFILTVMNSWILLLLLFIFPVDFIRK